MESETIRQGFILRSTDPAITFVVEGWNKCFQYAVVAAAIVVRLESVVFCVVHILNSIKRQTKTRKRVFKFRVLRSTQ